MPRPLLRHPILRTIILVAVGILVRPPTLRAQSPCATGTLADYASALNCSIDGRTLSFFSSFVSEFGSGASGAAPFQASNVLVTPVSGSDGAYSYLGFHFSSDAMSVSGADLLYSPSDQAGHASRSFEFVFNSATLDSFSFVGLTDVNSDGSVDSRGFQFGDPGTQVILGADIPFSPVPSNGTVGTFTGGQCERGTNNFVPCTDPLIGNPLAAGTSLFSVIAGVDITSFPSLTDTDGQVVPGDAVSSMTDFEARLYYPTDASTSTPEPATLSLMALGLITVGHSVVRRRRR